MGMLCKLLGHHWKGCQCTRCGQTRNEGHQWVEAEDKCEHTCSICGLTETVPCEWFHCRCERCGAVRDEHHLWLKKSACEQVCRICGMERETHNWKHVDRGVDRCTACGKTRRLSAEEIAKRDEEYALTDEYTDRADDTVDYSPEPD